MKGCDFIDTKWNIIQVISSISSTIISLVSVLIAVRALKQNNKIIREANKPYVVAYTDFIQVGSIRQTFLIIKNYGKTGATIDSISYSNVSFFAGKAEPFKYLTNCFIAPNQTYSSQMFFAKPYISFNVTIKCHDIFGKYQNSFSFNTEGIANQLAGATTNNLQSKLERTISTTAQEMLRKNL